MHSRGIKRKLCDSGVADADEERPSYGIQRQSLLDMSLVKLQHCHTLAEPDLCRSVLIANTVRQIQEEMDQDHGSCQVVPDPFMVSCGPESPQPVLDPHHVLFQNGHVLGPHCSALCLNSSALCLNSSALCLNSDMLCPNGDLSCRPPCAAAADQNQMTYDLCPDEEESSYCWGRAELKMMGHALLEEAESAAMMRPPRCILGRGEEEEEEDDEVFLGKLEMRSAPSSSSSSSGSVAVSNPGLEEFLSDVEASYYDLDTMAIGTATPLTTLTELDHIMEIIVGS